MIMIIFKEAEMSGRKKRFSHFPMIWLLTLSNLIDWYLFNPYVEL